MRYFKLFIMSALLCAAPSLLIAKELHAPVNLTAGAVIAVKVEQTGESEVDGQVQPFMGYVVTFTQTIEPIPNGYRVVQKRGELKFLPPKSAPFGKPGDGMPGVLTAFVDIPGHIKDAVFETDRNLSPVRVPDVAAFVEQMNPKPALDDPQLEAIWKKNTEVLSKKTPESAAQGMFRLQQQIAHLQGRTFQTSKPEIKKRPATARSFASSVTTTVDKVDTALRRAVVTTSDAQDAKALRKSMKARLDETKLAKAAFASMPVESSKTCRHEIDLDTGLVVNMDCTVLRAGITTAGRYSRRMERTVTTQIMSLAASAQ